MASGATPGVDITFIQAEAAAYHAQRERTRDPSRLREACWEASRQVVGDLEARGVAMRWQMERVLLESLSLSIERLLKHRSPIVRGLAVLDRRCGKRRLVAIDADAEHPFVQGMLEVRRAAEGIRAPATHGALAP